MHPPHPPQPRSVIPTASITLFDDPQILVSSPNFSLKLQTQELCSLLDPAAGWPTLGSESLQSFLDRLQPDGFILDVCLHRLLQPPSPPPASSLAILPRTSSPSHSLAVLQTPLSHPCCFPALVPSCIPSNIRARGFFPNPQLTMTLPSA
uniref:Uncharacterized protein n=1 Tax=Myotis myotis TaxID=51298 RepID=A0A7J7SC37_MYOMY|nr:hypothetical protein mMyoMyo1_009465 [Myotis myotis]